MERIIKGIFIPIEVWQSRELSWNEKVLLMEIDSFTSKGRDCYFSNAYIANLLGVKEDTASKLVSSLIRKGLIRMTRFDGRNRFLETCISFQCCLVEKSEADYENNPMQARTKIIDNNISNKQVNNSPNGDISNNTAPAKFSFRDSLRGLGVSAATVDAWMQVRKAQHAVNTEIAFQAVERELKKAAAAGHSAEDCIRLAVEKSWRGFNASWLEERPAPRTQAPVRRNVTDDLLALGREMFGGQMHQYDEQ